jgi:hypothetical protein
MADPKDKLQLSTLIDMTSPKAVMVEVSKLLLEILPAMDLKPLINLFSDLVRLFEGDYPGYHSCNTEYHNLNHTMDNVLALARIAHGASVSGREFQERPLRLGVISSFLHDTGYIQTTSDNTGTGAKYTSVHVERSIEFAKRYLKKNRFPVSDATDVSHMILCTDVHVNDIPFTSDGIRDMGLMVGTADLLGQMADRTYLEKLLFLYLEFKEGCIPGYEAERDMLVKTAHFYDLVKKRLEKDLSGVNRFLLPHFRKRWNIDCDLYLESINRNINYLGKIITEKNYRDRLRRGGIVKAIEEKEKGQS